MEICETTQAKLKVALLSVILKQQMTQKMCLEQSLLKFLVKRGGASTTGSTSEPQLLKGQKMFSMKRSALRVFLGPFLPMRVPCTGQNQHIQISSV